MIRDQRGRPGWSPERQMPALLERQTRWAFVLDKVYKTQIHGAEHSLVQFYEVLQVTLGARNVAEGRGSAALCVRRRQIQLLTGRPSGRAKSDHNYPNRATLGVSYRTRPVSFWQILWQAALAVDSGKAFPLGGRDRYRTCDLCRVNSATGCFTGI